MPEKGVVMPYAAMRRLHNVFEKKVSRDLGYRKAKKSYNETSRDMAFVESRFMRARTSRQ